jgi:hypothetical protein
MKIPVFIGCLLFWAVILVLHELGHFLAGVCLGVPRRKMMIRLFTWPPHVAIADGPEWIHPIRQHARYASVAKRYVRGRAGAILFIAGGVIGQTIGFVALMLVLARLGLPRYWYTPLTLSVVFPLCFYIISDVLQALRTQKPQGDFSALWRLSPLCVYLLVAGALVVHIATSTILAKYA